MHATEGENSFNPHSGNAERETRSGFFANYLATSHLGLVSEGSRFGLRQATLGNDWQDFRQGDWPTTVSSPRQGLPGRSASASSPTAS